MSSVPNNSSRISPAGKNQNQNEPTRRSKLVRNPRVAPLERNKFANLEPDRSDGLNTCLPKVSPIPAQPRNNLPLDPLPITPTRLPSRGTERSNLAVCMMVPLNADSFSKVGMRGRLSTPWLRFQSKG